MRPRHASAYTGICVPRFGQRLIAFIVSVVAMLGLAGCGGLEPVTTFEPTTDPARLYTRLELNERAINLATAAPYGTFQLTAMPLDAAGDPMTGLPVAIFTSSDTTAVWVTPGGELQARGSATGILVIAEVKTNDNIRHADTAYVNVTSEPVPTQLASLSIEPVPPDSAIWAMNLPGGYYIPPLFPMLRFFQRPPKPRALDAVGNPLPGLVVDVESLDPEIANYDRELAVLAPHHPGQVRMVARTVAYGVIRADTAVFTVTWPVVQGIQIVAGSDGTPSFVPNAILLAPRGMVFWENTLGEAVDVTFEDPTSATPIPAAVCDNFALTPDVYGPGPHCGNGNLLVSALPDPEQGGIWWTTQGRQFLTPGVYRYHTQGGAAGQITVTADLTVVGP